MKDKKISHGTVDKSYAVSTAPAAGGGLPLLQLHHSIMRSSILSHGFSLFQRLIWKRLQEREEVFQDKLVVNTIEIEY